MLRYTSSQIPVTKKVVQTRKPVVNAADAAINQMLAGAPARRAQAEREMRAADKKQQQVYGDSGRADLAPAREAQLTQDIQNRQDLISEESRRAAIPYYMQARRLGMELAMGSEQLKRSRAERDAIAAMARQSKQRVIQLPPGVQYKGGGFSYPNRHI